LTKPQVHAWGPGAPTSDCLTVTGHAAILRGACRICGGKGTDGTSGIHDAISEKEGNHVDLKKNSISLSEAKGVVRYVGQSSPESEGKNKKKNTLSRPQQDNDPWVRK